MQLTKDFGVGGSGGVGGKWFLRNLDSNLFINTFNLFQLRVTGSNLTGACKLVFKVARNERNDSLFLSSDVPGIAIDLPKNI